MDISKNKEDSWVKIHSYKVPKRAPYARSDKVGGGAPLFLEPYIFLIFIYYNRNIIFKELDHTRFQDKYMN